MVNLPKIDAHQHFWRYRPEEFPWIGAEMDMLRRDFLPAHVAGAMRDEQVTAAVAVQARPLVAETDWLLALAAEDPAIAGVVGWADFRAPDFAALLERWGTQAKFCGLRPMLQDMADPAALLHDRAFNGNMALLQEEGRPFDLLLQAEQLPHAMEFCARHDRHWIVLNHGGKPDIAAGAWDDWHKSITGLAAMPHIVCKLSGLVTQADWQDWRRQDVSRYAAALLDSFGPARLLFGSDWPVCTLAAAYGEVAACAASVTAACSPTERAAMFGGNALNFYNLRLEGAVQES